MNLIQLKEECSKMNIILNETQINQFNRYFELLVEWNNKINLTAITEFEDVVEKHFYDCLLPSKSIDIKGNLCDVGAGAGFPSIPLKIAFPSLHVTILEPLNKRCVFLNELVEELALENVTIVNARAEDYAKMHREIFDIVTARAVANLNMLSELCIPLVKLNCYFLAMKGASGHEEDQNATKAITTLGCKKVKEDLLKLSDGSNRVNILYVKIKKTPIQYPRMFAKIKKSPL